MNTQPPNPQKIAALADLERHRHGKKHDYVVVTEAFTYQDPIVGPVKINRGERILDTGHPAVLARPDLCEIAQAKRHARSRRPELNSATARQGERDDVLTGPSWALGPGLGLEVAEPVELSDKRSPFTVRLPRKVRDAIQQHAECIPRSHETGGMLIARRPGRGADKKIIELVEAWGPGPSSQLRRSSITLAWRDEHDRVRDYSQASDRQIVGAGSWHTHPGPSTGTPSQEDLDMFAAARCDLECRVWQPGIFERYLGIIGTNVGRSQGPDLYCWVIRRPRPSSRTLVCERAEIER